VSTSKTRSSQPGNLSSSIRGTLVHLHVGRRHQVPTLGNANGVLRQRPHSVHAVIYADISARADPHRAFLRHEHGPTRASTRATYRQRGEAQQDRGQRPKRRTRRVSQASPAGRRRLAPRCVQAPSPFASFAKMRPTPAMTAAAQVPQSATVFGSESNMAVSSEPAAVRMAAMPSTVVLRSLTLLPL